VNLSPKTVEFGATLSDPYFATGFFVVASAIALAIFCAVYSLRRRPRVWWFVSAIWVLNAWFLASEARFAIEFIASITYGVFNGGDGAGYWFIGPYVWAARLLGVAGLAFALWLRWRHRHARDPLAA
jgi:hypothetical protein